MERRAGKGGCARRARPRGGVGIGRRGRARNRGAKTRRGPRMGRLGAVRGGIIHEMGEEIHGWVIHGTVGEERGGVVPEKEGSAHRGHAREEGRSARWGLIRPGKFFVRQLLQLNKPHLGGKIKRGGGVAWGRGRTKTECRRVLGLTEEFMDVVEGWTLSLKEGLAAQEESFLAPLF